MTSVEDYRRNLRLIMEKYRPYTVLELGVEKGKSTRVFLEYPVSLTSIDLVKDEGVAKIHTGEYLIIDAREFLDKDERLWDMIFMDLTYYEQEKIEYGSKEAHEHCIKCWREDTIKAWIKLKRGGILVINDYINEISQRPYPQIAMNELAIKFGKMFEVYPSRGGLAVIKK